jgi:hypothetical protein
MKGGLTMGGAPRMHNMYGQNLAGHLHLGRQHVHMNSHEGIVS